MTVVLYRRNEQFLVGLALSRNDTSQEWRGLAAALQLAVGMQPRRIVNPTTRCVGFSVKDSVLKVPFAAFLGLTPAFPFMFPVLVSFSGNPFTRFPKDWLDNNRHRGLRASVRVDLLLLRIRLCVLPEQSANQPVNPDGSFGGLVFESFLPPPLYHHPMQCRGFRPPQWQFKCALLVWSSDATGLRVNDIESIRCRTVREIIANLGFGRRCGGERT